jgi:PKD repeat protein
MVRNQVLHVYDNSGDYEVCLVVTNLCEETSSSCTSIDVITAVEDDQKVVVELQYSIASNSITFVGGQTQIINLQLFDSNGKVVHTQSGNTNSPMTIPTLSAGIYVASVENAAGEHLLNEKLVIAQ